MTTNLLATILLLYTTNSVEHWPKFVQGYRDLGSLGDRTKVYPFGDSIPANAQWVYADNTDSDTKSVETTIAGQLVLRLPEKWFGYWEPGHAIDILMPPQAIVLTNWVTQHYSVDYRRVRTNAMELLSYGQLINRPDVKGSDLGDILMKGQVQYFEHRYDTNWFEPVATNTLPK